MSRFQEFFKRTSLSIEDYPLPLTKYVALFAALLSIRLCLEFFANHRLFTIDDVVHIGLWFIFIVLAFIVQLHFFSKVSMEKVIKLVVCCFSIALSAPIIDLIVSQGTHSKMNYISINSTQDIVKAYFTIGGASLTRGATIGIRIEIILLVFASFNYIYIRTKSIIRALIGTFSIYTVLFLTGIIPFLIGKLNSLFNLSYTSNDQSSIYLLFTLDLVILLILLFLLRRKEFNFKLTKAAITVFISVVIPFLLGVILARLDYPVNWTLNPTTIYYFPLLTILLIMLMIYQYSLISDTNFRKNRLVQSSLFILLFAVSTSISFHTLFAVFLIWSFNFILYEKPCDFFAITILNHALAAFRTVAYVFLGFMMFGAPMVGLDKMTILFILMFSFSASFAFSKIKSYFS